MKQKDFEILISNLENRIENCEMYLGGIKCTEDLDVFMLSEIRDLRDFCIAESKAMTEIVMVELYHIIGMGKLTATQTMAFMSKMKLYLSYRPMLKTFASHLQSIDDLPKIPVHNKYQLSYLATFWLYSDVETEDAVEDTASIEDYKPELRKALAETNCPYTLEGKNIFIKIKNLEEFFNCAFLFGCTTGDFATLKRKIESHGTYFGIKWIRTDTDTIYGKVDSPKIYTKLKDFLVYSKVTK